VKEGVVVERTGKIKRIVLSGKKERKVEGLELSIGEKGRGRTRVLHWGKGKE